MVKKWAKGSDPFSVRRVKLGALDASILVVYMLAMVGFGVWVGRRQESSADFMVGGRDVPWWVILFSIVATETSTVTFLSIPGFAYGRRIMTWLQMPFSGSSWGGFLVAFGVAAAVLRRADFFTAYEVLDKPLRWSHQANGRSA